MTNQARQYLGAERRCFLVGKRHGFKETERPFGQRPADDQDVGHGGAGRRLEASQIKFDAVCSREVNLVPDQLDQKRAGGV
jgi:hypothetical protein